jgi:monoamine oxidase
VLVALAAADWAARVLEMGENAAVASALGDLAALFPSAAPAATLQRHALSDWGDDPWALGAFSYYAGGCWACGVCVAGGGLGRG